MWGKSKSFRLLISLKELSEVPLFFSQIDASHRNVRLIKTLFSGNQEGLINTAVDY